MACKCWSHVLPLIISYPKQEEMYFLHLQKEEVFSTLLLQQEGGSSSVETTQPMKDLLHYELPVSSDRFFFVYNSPSEHSLASMKEHSFVLWNGP